MSHPANDTELVRMYLQEVLDEVYGLDEFMEKADPTVTRRQLYRWKKKLEAGEKLDLKAASRRKVIEALGLETADVLPYPDNGTSRAS